MKSPGRLAADAILDGDADGGAGNPELIRRAAVAARQGGDAEYAEELVVSAAAWERYLANLSRALFN